jgi:predicted permease
MLAVLRRLWFAIRRRRFERELTEELAFHREMKQREFETAGLGAVDARRAAARSLGSLALAQDRSRDVWQPRWLQGLGQDVRLAFRALAAAPIVSLAAVFSLALGIGANTATFSLINSLLLRTLPVASAERLVTITTPRSIGLGGSAAAWPYPVWQQLWQRREMFDGIVAWSSTRFNIASGGETEFVQGLWVDGSYFETLGVPAILGRTFRLDDDRRGGGNDGPVAVISYAFWRRRFGGAADAIGRTLTLEHVPFTVVGVAPPEFFGSEVGRTFDVALPIGTEPLLHGGDSWLDGMQYQLSVMARLKPGDSASRVTTKLRGIQPVIREATLPRGNDPSRYLAEPFALAPAGSSYIRGRYGRALMTLMVVVGLVLLVACANIANLLLARVAARGHELSVRLALGAPRWRLVRQLFTESAVLSAIGTLSALLVADWGSRMLVQQISTRNNSVFLDLSIDWRVLAFTTGVAVATTVLFGSGPALRSSSGVPVGAMSSRVRGPSSDPRTALASSLIVLQVSLSVVLVVAAGLFVRTFTALSTRPLGFEHENVLLVTVNAQRADVAPAARMAMFERVREAIGQLPEVADAALSTQTPISGGGMVLPRIDVSGGATVPATILGGIANAYGNVVSPTWLNTMGMPLVAGRAFTAADRQGSLRVAVVNQAVSSAFLNGENPIGHSLTLGPNETPLDIVGMVADSIYLSIREPVPPTVYLPLAQSAIPPPMLASLNLSVRAATGSPARLTRGIIAAAARVDPDLALTFRPLADQVGASVTQERVVAMLSGFFGALALLLAGVGLYGVTAYAVNRRRREIGIRIALGAARQRVVAMVLSRVTRLVALGIVIGTAVSIWASRFVATLLYDVEPRDPATIASAAAVLAFVGLAAGWLPARRAAHVDPAVVLRDE